LRIDKIMCKNRHVTGINVYIPVRMELAVDQRCQSEIGASSNS
jgi:hypothetical protein